MSSSDAAKTVLITGATGTTGRAAVRESLALGLHVRALVRSIDERSRALAGLGAEIVVGDLLEINSIRPVLPGTDQALRTDQGDEMVLKNNVFIEKILPDWTLRTLDDEEMAEYRRPYLEPGESRRPTLTWPRQIPAEGKPADVTRIVEEYAQWLATTPGIPKLFVNAEPGVIRRDRQRAVSLAGPD
jgi:NAD(P)-dependent dehydrogenase (short-subunit alcohol dehydrogenase family)